MLIETDDLLTATNAAWTAGLTASRFQEYVRAGQIKPFVRIDGISFYHRSEALALRRFHETMHGQRPTKPLPRTQDLF
jgi:hypothetical protein